MNWNIVVIVAVLLFGAHDILTGNWLMLVVTLVIAGGYFYWKTRPGVTPTPADADGPVKRLKVGAGSD
jgi:hypothetical protein